MNSYHEQPLEVSDPCASGVEASHGRFLRRMRIYWLYWLMWVGGAALIALSWLGAIAPSLMWVGVGMAAAGCALALFTCHPTHERHDPLH